MQSPFMKRFQNKDQGVAGRKAEVSLAQRVNGTLRPGSGALVSAKGDVVMGDFLIENKSSTRESFSISKDQLHKIYREALETAKTPALAFQFVTLTGASDKKDRWICMPETAFKSLVGE